MTYGSDAPPPRRTTKYERFRSQGLCGQCGRCPPLPDRSRCQECTDRAKTSRGRSHVLNPECCINCSRPKDPKGGLCCVECKTRAAAAKLRKVKVEGKCSVCTKRHPEAGQKTCASCFERLREKRLRLKDEVFGAYGGYVCRWCGTTDRTVLVIDHVHNDGAEHRRQIGTGGLYSWLKRSGFPEGFQVLCYNDNIRKARGCTGPFQGPCGDSGPSVA